MEAAAGTGKTTRLVRYIVECLEEGLDVGRLVAVTYTEKAAGELKLRLRAELERALRVSDRPGRLEAALARLEEARISTLHGFCGDLLRERPVEAGLSPGFTVLDEAASRRLFRETFDLWLHQQLAAPPEGLRRFLSRPSREAPSRVLGAAAWQLAEWRDMDRPWSRPAWDRRAAVDQAVGLLARFVRLRANPDRPGDRFYRDTAEAEALLAGLRRLERVRPRDYDTLEGSLAALAGNPRFARPEGGTRGRYNQQVTRQELRQAHTELLASLQALARDSEADVAALLQQELQGALEAYRQRKEDLGCVDFLDLLLVARQMLRRPEVLEELRRRFDLLCVDEFQDTDPLQAEILLLLAGDSARLVLVGDPKQSIYRFRRADVGVYRSVCRSLQEQGAGREELSTSYRAVPNLQRAINHAFAPLMNGDEACLQASYVPLQPHRQDPPGRPSLVALPVPRPYGYRGLTSTAIEASLPGAVAGFLAWLLEHSGWKVEGQPLRPQHVCLLFARFTDAATRPYAEALEARGIPHLLVGGRSYHVRPEVEAARTALTAIEWPDDELSVYATLHGPFFGYGDAELLEFREAFGRLDPLRPPADEDLPVAQALRLLGELHRGRHQRSIAETLGRLLQATRAHVGLVLRPSGEQALANVLHLEHLARAYEASGGTSFRGFIEALEDQSEEEQAAAVPILEEGTEGVRMMTVHKAKGLEFPVVVLADISYSVSRSRPSRWLDPRQGLCAFTLAGLTPLPLRENEAQARAIEEAEAVRLAYVAATRARDLLVVPALGDGPWEPGWVAPLNRALYPPEDQEPRPAPGCPCFPGQDTVLDRGPLAGERTGLRPGLYRIADFEVVWWDPSLLDLEDRPGRGLRHQDLLKGDPARVEEGLAAHTRWAEERQEALRAGSRPSLVVRAVSEDLPEVPGAAAVETVRLDTGPGPHGPRYGALVHALLATVPLDGDETALWQAVQVQARILGAPMEERTAAVAAARAALEHPLLQEARQARVVHRETPVNLVLPDGSLASGVVDLACLGPGGWLVVDFKTGAQMSRSEAAWRRQVALYVQAVATATGQPARGVILVL